MPEPADRYRVPPAKVSCPPTRGFQDRRADQERGLLLVRIDYWNYTTEADTKMGKVGISITMIEAKNGKTIWRAVHNRASDYVIIKPDLPDVARGLIREMIGHMPH
jgi:hypothetical protein